MVTKTQMQNYLGLLGSKRRLEEQIQRCRERATDCTAKISAANTAPGLTRSDKVGNCATEIVKLERELADVMCQIEEIDGFIADLRNKDAVMALAMELYFMDEVGLSYRRTYDKMKRYLPHNKVPSAAHLCRRIDGCFAQQMIRYATNDTPRNK